MQIELITKREASRRAKVSEKTIYAWIKQGKLNEYKVPKRKRTLISLKEINDKML